MIGKLLKPAIYLSIKMDDGKKSTLDFLLPSTIAIIFSVILMWLYKAYEIDVFSEKHNLMSGISGFIQTLPGFFIAALAAIATFPNAMMNNILPEPTPYLENSNGMVQDKLSRRRLLSYLFSYLTFISIIGYFMVVLVVFLQSLNLKLPPITSDIFYFIGCFLPILLLAHIVCLTFFGLWYLGDRIHLNDPANPNPTP